MNWLLAGLFVSVLNRGSEATTYQSCIVCGSLGSPIDSSTPVTFDAGSE